LAHLTDRDASASTADALRWADHAVLAFGEATPTAGVDDRRRSELEAVLRGLAAVSEGRFDEALEAVAGVSRRSPFAHWRWFLKGQVAFYRGERALATRAFAEIPAASVPGRAARAYQWLCGPVAGKPEEPPEASVISRACAIMGESLPGEILLAAERHWQQQQLAEVYDTLRARLAGFPSESTVLTSALSHFCLNATFSASSDSSSAFDGHLGGLADKARFKSPAEEMMVLRVLCTHAGALTDSKLTGRSWVKVLHLMAKLHGPSPRRDSIGYAWLGEYLAQEEPSFFPWSRRSDLRDAQGAIFAYEQSLRLDPQNYQAHLALCALYERLHQISDRNRLLDRMARQFPDRKEVLLRTGRGCLDRKAFRKGLGYLSRARELDRLDPAIPDALVEGYCELAAEQAKSGKPQQAQASWASAFEYAVDKPADLARARWTILARQAVAERDCGDLAAAEHKLEEARLAGVPLPALASYLQLAAGARSRRCLDEPFPGLPPAAGPPSMDVATLLVNVVHHWQGKGVKLQETSPALLAAGAYVEAAVVHAFESCQARALAEALGQDNRFKYERELLVDKMLEQDQTEPYFRLLRAAETIEHAGSDHGASHLRPELESIVREALARGDARTAHQARTLASRLDHAQESAEWADDEEDEDATPWFDEPAPNLPPPQAAAANFAPPLHEAEMALEGLMAVIAAMPEDELRAMERTPPPGIPPEIFAALVETVRKPPRKPPRPSRTGPEQRQTELPF
jgi:tetratricopeptide (TPR) repeat protein